MFKLYKGGQPSGITSWEIINYPERHAGWYEHIQLAIDGVPCIPFSLPAEVRDSYDSLASWESMLVRQAVALIDQFGDARDPRAWQAEGRG